MDWGRFQRAIEARGIAKIEVLRKAAIGDSTKMTPELAAMIVKFDELLSETSDDG